MSYIHFSQESPKFRQEKPLSSIEIYNMKRKEKKNRQQGHQTIHNSA